MKDNKRSEHENVFSIPEVGQTENLQSAKPAHRTTSVSEAARCEGEVDKDLTDALHQSDSFPQGTALSNTVTQYPITAIVNTSSF